MKPSTIELLEKVREGEVRAVVTVEYDQFAEGPASWDNPYDLITPGKTRYGYAEGIEFLECGVCGFYPEDHAPMLEDMTAEEWQEDYGHAVHDWTPREGTHLVEIDSRGPYTTIHMVEAEEVLERLEDRDLGGFRKSDIAAMVARSESEGWNLGEDILELTLEEWRTYFEGNVYAVSIEVRNKCGECSSFTIEDWEDSLCGIYGEAGVMDYLREVLSDSDINYDQLQTAGVVFRGDASYIL